MSMVEFQTYIDRDTITLPEEYRNRVKGRARIIILTEDTEEEDMIDFLLDHPYKVEAFTPLSRDQVHERR